MRPPSVVLELGGDRYDAWPDEARATVSREMFERVRDRRLGYAWRGLAQAAADLRAAAFLLCDDAVRDIVSCAADAVEPEPGPLEGPNNAPWAATLRPVLRALRDPDLGSCVRRLWPLDGTAVHSPVQRARSLAAAETSTVRVRELSLSRLVLGDWPRLERLVERGFRGRLTLSDCFDVPYERLPPDTELVRCHLRGDRLRKRLHSTRKGRATTQRSTRQHDT